MGESHGSLSISDLLLSVLIVAAGPVVVTIGTGVVIFLWLETNGSKIVIKRKKYDV